MKNPTNLITYIPSFVVHILMVLLLVGFQVIYSQDYSISSYQITDKHRVDKDSPGLVGGFWGHHLGHMVRTATQGLWYVDDTGIDVNRNPAINYHHFDGIKWNLIQTLTNPSTIQQNTATLAVGDTIYTYGLNINGGYIEEAIFDAKTNSAVYNRQIQSTGPSTNYIGAALSPNGSRIVWWTKVDYNGGPSDWVYIYTKDGVWSTDSIVTKIPGNDFSYVFASFLDDTTFYVGGEVPSGLAPNWTYEVGAGKVVIGEPISGFTKMKGSNTAANDIWVNSTNGDAHLFTYGSYGMIGYFYKPANGTWNDTVYLVEVGNVSRWRFIDSPDGNLYLIMSQGGFKFMMIPKNTISGKINFDNIPIHPINSDDGFTSSYAIWPEVKEFQTTPVGGINFAYPGNDFEFSNLLRHVEMAPHNGSVIINVNMPNGNEVFEADFNQKLSWYTYKDSGVDSIRIELSTDGGIEWSTSVSKAPNTGSYVWKVSKVASSNCLIRLSSINTATVYDVSNAPFTIRYTPVVEKPPIAKILRPTKDSSVVVNEIFSLRGAASDTDGYIVNYRWNMGDGQIITGIVTEFDYLYENTGTFVVTLTAQDNDNVMSIPDSLIVTVTNSTSVNKQSDIPETWVIHGNYPNPFNAHTQFQIQSGISVPMKVGIINVLGQHVKTLFRDDIHKGTQTIAWDGTDASNREAPTGVYFARFETAIRSTLIKILLLR